MGINPAPHIAISIGDFNGIGPEIVLKHVKETDLGKSTPVIISPVEVINFYSEKLSLQSDFHIAESVKNFQHGKINILPIDFNSAAITPGKQSSESGEIAMKSIKKAIKEVVAGNCAALVTSPISKEAIHLAGYQIPGHTEYLASQTNTDSVLMMLVNNNLRVALATTHIPISKVAGSITGALLHRKIELLNSSLKNDFGIVSPRIAVFGLNPHASDGGVIGTEEIEKIIPALEEMRAKGITADGPFPADGFFGQKLHEQYDAILAMYHDQGLAPFKLLSFGRGVNFTAGLPIIRTSPDHGTAFNIAGNGVADPSSFKQAYTLALQLANKRIREAANS
ncbi:MAG: 4-hydroxythreonine-4-phosphate dehydrogenase PdxA [Balneolaceae bacterium]